MNPTQVTHLYTQICVEAPGLSDDEVAQSMIAHGCPPNSAVDATRFLPLAFGRQFLNGLGISFAEKYWLFSSEGKIDEEGLLPEHSLFKTALELAPALMSKPVVSNIVVRSSEVNAVNNAMNNGSQPSNLRLAPVAFFNGEPSKEGFNKAQEHINAFLKQSQSAEGKKPWWKVW